MTSNDRLEGPILVTGATGFIGSYLAKRLLTNGREVHLLVRPSSEVPSELSGATTHHDPGTAEGLIELVGEMQPTTCYHLATYFVGVHKPADLTPLVMSNIEFGLRLADACSTVEGLAFVNTGTVWQHYQSEPYNPVSLYAATKQAFADLLRFYSENANLHVVTLLLNDSYGPNDNRKKLVDLLLRMAREGGTLPMSGGEQLIDLTHVNDIVSAMLLAPAFAATGGAAPEYSVRSQHPLQLRDLVQVVEKITNSSIDIQWGARPYRVREMFEEWKPAPILPGWQPTIPLEVGLKEISQESTNE